MLEERQQQNGAPSNATPAIGAAEAVETPPPEDKPLEEKKNE